MKFRCKRCGDQVLVDGTALGPPLPQSTPIMQAVTPPEPTRIPLRAPTETQESKAEAATQAPTLSSASTDPTKRHKVRPVMAPPRPTSINQDGAVRVEISTSDEPEDPAWANFEALMRPPKS